MQQAGIPRSGKTSCLSQPILASKAVDARELSFIVGDDGAAECDGLGGNEQIVPADRPAGLFKAGADQAIDCICGRLEW